MESTSQPVEKKRLIVLLPDQLTGNLELAQKIYSLARHNHSNVFYLVLVDEEDNALRASRGMATMKAITSGDEVVVTSKQTKASNWLKTLKEIFQPFDTIVCHEEQRVKSGLMKTIPISAFLKSNFRAPIVILSGFYQPWTIQTRQWLMEIIFWMGCAVILGAFSLLEVQIDHEIHGLASTALLLLVVGLEFSALWAWSKIPKP